LRFAAGVALPDKFEARIRIGWMRRFFYARRGYELSLPLSSGNSASQGGEQRGLEAWEGSCAQSFQEDP